MLDVTSFSDEAWFHFTGYVNPEYSQSVDEKSPIEATFTLSNLEYGVHCLTLGLLGQFYPKTQLTQSATRHSPSISRKNF
jgi:hypothetical protein